METANKENQTNVSGTYLSRQSDSDENEISLYIITTYSNIQVMRIKEIITKDKMP